MITAAASKYSGGTPFSKKASGITPGSRTPTKLNKYAARVPTAISENMFKFIVRNDLAPRTNNGHPHQKTTGVARASCNQPNIAWLIQSAIRKPTIGPIAIRSSSTDSATPTQKRRFMSAYCLSSPSSAIETTLGSKSIPQIGQSPGPTCSISGCMGQV
ncbi:hypothetical protein TBK1r_47950 [Stieleria magnilauensis]|uniref:Uncharacterized protein n=1 Tax=Stieleria magnilauensis TaxID=2527963 RepID=A0ABX5Y120_9BACT|nr:hypothetical protein TBK1r_47950 [Planctomycetes bacterium TBK1r]